MKEHLARIAGMRIGLREKGPGRFPDQPGFNYPPDFVEGVMFDQMNSTTPIYVFPGGYLDQDPTLDEDVALMQRAYLVQENEVKKPRFGWQRK